MTTKTEHFAFKMVPDEVRGRMYCYADDLVQVSEHEVKDENENKDQHNDEDAQHSDHHWTGSLLQSSEPPDENQENPAHVTCGGGTPCSECQSNPPCGGTIMPAAKATRQICIRADAKLQSSEISFTNDALHRIAILEPSLPGKPVCKNLDAWRGTSTTSNVVYHVYKIDKAPSWTAIEGKLIAIPVTPPPLTATPPIGPMTQT